MMSESGAPEDEVVRGRCKKSPMSSMSIIVAAGVMPVCGSPLSHVDVLDTALETGLKYGAVEIGLEQGGRCRTLMCLIPL